MIEIKDLASDDFSQKLSLRYYPRSMKVRAKEDFVTPSRMINDTEYNKKAAYPNQTKLDDYVSVITQYFKSSDLESFINENGAMKKLSGKILDFSKVAIDSPLSVLSLRPSNNVRWPTLKLEQAMKFLRFLNYAEGRLTTRSLPPFSLDGNFAELVNSFCSNNDEHDSIVWLDIREDAESFKRKLDIVASQVKEKRLQIIGFQMRPFDKFEDYNVNLDYVYSQLHKKEVLLMLEGPNKAFTRNQIGPSKLHYHPFECFDIISPTRYERGGSSKRKPTIIETINKIKFLKTEDVSLQKYEQLGPQYHNIKKYADNSLQRIIDSVEELRSSNARITSEGQSNVNRFRAFSYIQQIKEAEIELNAMSRRIRAEDTFDYLNEKVEFGKVVKKGLKKS